MNKAKILIVGAFPKSENKVFGGNVTDGKCLINSSFSKKYTLILIDSTQKSNPPPNFLVRLFYAILRLFTFFYKILLNRPQAVILFTAVGMSVIEKGVMAWISRFLYIPAFIFPGAGLLIKRTADSKFNLLWVKAMLSGGKYFLCQGPAWQNFAVSKLKYPIFNAPIIPNWTATDKLIEIGTNRDLSLYKPKLQILFLAWLEKEKGIFELLHSSLYLVSRNINFKLVIAGSGTAEKDAKDFVKKHNLDNFIEFVGWVSGDIRDYYFKSSDIFILPSYSEGLPNSMIEAMSTGLAVIITNVGNIPDIVIDREHVLLIEPKNSKILSSRMEELITNKTLLNKLSINGRKLAINNFSVEPAISKLGLFIDKIIYKN
jgi:glycosyltransferase involved in cell wall biosynthesis